ncbi:MAG: Xaa-Pro dipeptidyl-peptidase [Gemmatimonadota bacterium]|nr:Xaa-Pro dipeptidyl-peptidase [Gemmatimonadota bacterium]
MVLSALASVTIAVGHLPAQQGATVPRATPRFVDGQAQIVPEFQDATLWVRQRLWVETSFDSDGDGKKDRMHVDVTRPRQTETEGLKVAVVYESSPYFAGTSGDTKYLWNVQQEVGAPPPPRTHQPEIPFKGDRTSISTSEVNTWVPRGFAVVHSEAPGTGLSQGCPTVGGLPEEQAPRAVIDWLNGRAKGFTARVGGDEVKATWSTGKVGMTGTSYNGTIPLAAATTGVAGLEAIIPIAPNTGYYQYYRSNGLVRHPGGWLGEDIDFLYDFIFSGDTALRAGCNATIRDGLYVAGRDRQHGDYNAFWAERDLLNKISGVKAATLLAHGENDWNVVLEHSTRIYEALKKQGTPAALYLHQGGHGGPPTLELRNKWFSHYLYGVDNGIDRDPRLYVVREGQPVRGGVPTAYADYPNPEARAVVLCIQGEGLGIWGGKGKGAGCGKGKGKGTAILTDNAAFSGAALASLALSPHRLLYSAPLLKDTLHWSGTPQVTIRLASSKPAANLSVWLVTLPFDSTKIGSEGAVGVQSRGWADPQNHASLTKGGNYNSMLPGEPLVPGTFYDLTFDLQPGDRMIPPGKRLALMIMSSDRDFTLWPQAGTTLTVDLSKTYLTLPVVGGSKW